MLRRMRWWDLEEVARLESEVFGDSAWSVETFWSELAAPDRWYVVLDDDAAGGGGLLGYAGLMVNGADADVQTIALSARSRGRGLGALLLESLVGEAGRRGASSLMLEVASDNDAALRLYASRGFERLAVRRGYYQPSGTDAYVMRLRPLPTLVG